MGGAIGYLMCSNVFLPQSNYRSDPNCEADLLIILSKTSCSYSADSNSISKLRSLPAIS